MFSIRSIEKMERIFRALFSCISSLIQLDLAMIANTDLSFSFGRISCEELRSNTYTGSGA